MGGSGSGEGTKRSHFTVLYITKITQKYCRKGVSILISVALVFFTKYEIEVVMDTHCNDGLKCFIS